MGLYLSLHHRQYYPSKCLNAPPDPWNLEVSSLLMQMPNVRGPYTSPCLGGANPYFRAATFSTSYMLAPSMTRSRAIWLLPIGYFLDPSMGGCSLISQSKPPGALGANVSLVWGVFEIFVTMPARPQRSRHGWYDNRPRLKHVLATWIAHTACYSQRAKCWDCAIVLVHRYYHGSWVEFVSSHYVTGIQSFGTGTGNGCRA